MDAITTVCMVPGGARPPCRWRRSRGGRAGRVGPRAGARWTHCTREGQVLESSSREDANKASQPMRQLALDSPYISFPESRALEPEACDASDSEMEARAVSMSLNEQKKKHELTTPSRVALHGFTG